MSEPTKELNLNKSQELINSLTQEATEKQNPADVSPTVRAWLSIELIKQAVDDGKIMPGDAWGFAEDLQNHNGVPVTIGTPEVKIFPAESILNARKPIVENLREAAKKEGIDFDEINSSIKEIGLKVMTRFDKLSKEVIEKYLPFQLAPDSGVDEVFSTAKTNESVRQMLSGELNAFSKDQKEAVNNFFKVNFPNIVFGDLLKDWLKKNYSIKEQ